MEITLCIGVDAQELDRSNGSISSRVDTTAGKRACGDRGATLVEAAFYTPLLLLLLFGVLEFGLAFRSYLTVSNGTRDGSRMASVIADSTDADFQILKDIKASTSAIPASSIEQIVIWRATGPDDDVPSTCAAGVANSSSVTPCNVYEPADFTRPVEDFGCDAGSPDRFWCPTDRNTNLSDPPDYVGIWIKVRHGFVTGMFGSDLTITDKTIMRIEPQGLS